jgi:leader peptidase (prepilin peptidase)/N-methyltransferase
LVETLAGLLFLACALHFTGVLPIAKYCAFCFLLLGLIFTDLECLLLPDELTLGGLAVGMGFSLVAWVQGVPGWMLVPRQPWELRLVSLLHSAIGALVGAGVVYLIAEVYFRVRGIEGMGLGDVKLMGMIGAFLGMRLALFTLFAGSALGAVAGILILCSVFAKRLRRYRSGRRAWQSARRAAAGIPIPFGTFLGVAALVAAFWGERVMRWYFGMW